jgi:hydantoinase/carbamoylase family amidase
MNNYTTATIDKCIYLNMWEEINQFGCNDKTGGVNRVGYSDADFEARRWFMNKSMEYGFTTRMDEVGNVFSRYGPSDGPCIMSGSHIDSVPEGGKYDGVLGAIAALECCRAMKAANIYPKIAVECVATAEEEGRFGGMLGSQAIAGLVEEAWVGNSKDADGITLKEAMKSQGLNALNYAKCKRSGKNDDDTDYSTMAATKTDIAAFIELHIEQGPVLEQQAQKIGIVDGIAGTINPLYTFTGEANHSGTTPMHLRKDPMTAFTFFGSKLEDIITQYGSENARITIGKVDVFPNFVHTVPGVVKFCVNIRDNYNNSMLAMFDAVNIVAKEACDKYGCEMNRDDSLGSLNPVRLDARLTELMVEEADKLMNNASNEVKEKSKGSHHHQLYQVMTSGAGHDAQNFQHICPSGMIFIPSRRGISHSPEEYTDWEDVMVGTQLLCNVLCRLSS